MRPQIVKILTLILFVLNSIAMLAQTAGPPPPSPGRRPPQAPIDSDLYILVIVGLLYGTYVAYKKYCLKNKLS